MKPPDRLTIFDTTLRDGEQSPGCSMNHGEKLLLAHALSELGVDVIEAGFPSASPGDFESVQAIAREVSTVTIAGLCRCHRGDIERCWEAVKGAERPRIHTFIATSPIHREHKLGMSKDEVLAAIGENVSLARSLCSDVQFSAEDATRTEFEFLVEVSRVAIEAGATTINVPDTVGYSTPQEFCELMRRLVEAAGREGVTFSAHCHDDLGLAVANSLAAIQGGARQVECTINGIGERAGNASLEEVVMATKTRADQFGVAHEINTERLYPTSRLLTQVTGVHVQPNKAIVGENAFAHEAGIHQHGMLKHRTTYEIMRPADVGIGGSRLVLGKHSGRHAFKNRIIELGLQIEDAVVERAFEEFKQLADRKKDITDADIEALVCGTGTRSDGPWFLDAMTTTGGRGAVPAASVRVRHLDGREQAEAAVGDGPVDATFKALARATGVDAVIRKYEVHSVTFGQDAQGQVSVDLQCDGQNLRGRGLSTDIIEASAMAYVDAINRIRHNSLQEQARKQRQEQGKQQGKQQPQQRPQQIVGDH